MERADLEKKLIEMDNKIKLIEQTVIDLKKHLKLEE